MGCHVSGKDDGDDCPPEEAVVVVREVGQEIILGPEEDFEGGGGMHVFIDTGIVVLQSNVSCCVDQEFIGESCKQPT